MAAAPDEGGSSSSSSSSTSSHLSRLLADTVLQIPHALRNLVSASRLLPSDEDFHFYNNFREFREPLHALAERAEAVMSQISSSNVLGEASALPDDSEELYDWLVNLQDDLLEQVDASFDQFKADRAKKGLPAEDDGFMIQDRKKRRKQGRDAEPAINNSQSSTIVERSDVRFHKWELARPQEKFQDTVDNSNAPFKHPNNAHPLQVLSFYILFCLYA
jgi:exosome complex exonuclease RRP6